MCARFGFGLGGAVGSKISQRHPDEDRIGVHPLAQPIGQERFGISDVIECIADGLGVCLAGAARDDVWVASIWHAPIFDVPDDAAIIEFMRGHEVARSHVHLPHSHAGGRRASIAASTAFALCSIFWPARVSFDTLST